MNAGTFEFLVDLTHGPRDDAPFYFLEMNTRLQVEHPVTEQVTGVDLVRAQFLVASGERLPWTQGALTQRGHAIEARVYAEAPSQGFIPQAGTLLLYREPSAPGVRIDSGFREGDVVTVHYDALHGQSDCYSRHAGAGDRAPARGPARVPHPGHPHECPVPHPRAAERGVPLGGMHTGYLDTEGDVLATEPDEPPPAFLRAALDAADHGQTSGAGRVGTPAWDPWTLVRDWSVR